MNAYDWTWVAAVCGFVVAFVSYCHRDDDRAWQRSTQVEQDPAECQTHLKPVPAIEQQPGDPYSDDRIDLERMFIPHQRQPRKDQP